jgi:hypothetical protein
MATRDPVSDSDQEDSYHHTEGDLNDIRGMATAANNNNDDDDDDRGSEETDLDNLAELVPDIKNRRGQNRSQEASLEGADDRVVVRITNSSSPRKPAKHTKNYTNHDSSGHLMDASGHAAGEITTRSDDPYDMQGMRSF